MPGVAVVTKHVYVKDGVDGQLRVELDVAAVSLEIQVANPGDCVLRSFTLEGEDVGKFIAWLKEPGYKL
jgi:hypothetical protein